MSNDEMKTPEYLKLEYIDNKTVFCVMDYNGYVKSGETLKGAICDIYLSLIQQEEG